MCKPSISLATITACVAHPCVVRGPLPLLLAYLTERVIYLAVILWPSLLCYNCTLAVTDTRAHVHLFFLVSFYFILILSLIL